MIDDKKSAPHNEFYDLAPELFNMFEHIKALVIYVKQANLQDELAKTLKQDNETRRNYALLDDQRQRATS